MKIQYHNEKLSTHIEGLDRILFGGIQLQNSVEFLADSGSPKSTKPLTIVIQGELGTSKSLLGMQLLHGLTKSLRKLGDIKDDTDGAISLVSSVFYSENSNRENFSDMLLDMLISQYTSRIIEDRIIDESRWNGSLFSSAIFDIEKQSHAFTSLKYNELDRYIAEGKVIYNNRTNALHLMYDANAGSNNANANLIAKRKYDNLLDYIRNGCVSDDELAKDFFPISIMSSENFSMDFNDEYDRIPCLLLDSEQSELPDHILARSLIVIRIVEENKQYIAKCKPDMVIRMRISPHKLNGYLQHQISIAKSVLQTTANGWHICKKQDYGFEVYPSSHVLLQRRRHMSKELLRTHLGILSETYAQYVASTGKNDPEERRESGNSRLLDYENKVSVNEERRWKDLIDSIGREECVSKILKDILLNDEKFSGNCGKFEHESQVTAIIGEANTYKRYLTLGSTFCACCRKEQTLKLLFDKEGNIMLRRIICPAMRLLKENAQDVDNALKGCRECYEYIHFKEIRMGCISPDELFYYLIKQIRLSREARNGTGSKAKYAPIKRLIIDDLMKIDFCFPMLQDDSLFLTTLISICRDMDIELMILCDKSARLAHELRFQADNVICTERTPKDILLYVEKFSGYNDPSRIYGCRISRIDELFYCDKADGGRKICLNEKCISGVSVSSMSGYWVSNDTDKLFNGLRNR